MTPDKIDLLLEKVESLRGEVRVLTERARVQEELIDEMMPILRLVVQVGGEKLEALEQRGYFAFGRAALEVADRVVTGFTPDDVAQLGENVVRILSTVKRMTQPAVLAIADEATEALEESKGAEPLSWRGMIRASRDEDVQRGVAAAVAVLKRVGRMAAEAREARRGKEARLERLLGPSRSRTAPAAPELFQLAAKIAPRAPANGNGRGNGPAAPARPAPPRAAPAATAAAATTATTAAALAPSLSIPGVQLDAEGFLVDASAWNRDIAAQIAAAVGFPELTDAHWKVISFARDEYEKTKKSPNVRRMSAGAEMSIKELYALFPGAPGKTAARIAGLPKPVGCI
ncbi:MAG: TusE/DsrC/DsvC family sulfur relay protein [Deltaproteobacteria bacterium]|nr:TusE/DsrC/DsvC family sulfur relay protein [Deltaproteobacteria bacterium]